MITNLTTETFSQFLHSQKFVLVDFWATWCQPCKMMLPVLEQVSEELASTLAVAKVDVDANPDLASGITSVPTLRLYKDGEVVLEVTGAKPKPALLLLLEEHLQN